MTREEAKDVFLNHGFIKVEGCRGRIFNGDKWRDACIVISEWLKEEPKSEWDHDHEILRAYGEGANNVLEKISNEIESKIKRKPSLNFTIRERERNDAFLEVLDIIDKYKTESEGT